MTLWQIISNVQGLSVHWFSCRHKQSSFRVFGKGVRDPAVCLLLPRGLKLIHLIPWKGHLILGCSYSELVLREKGW